VAQRIYRVAYDPQARLVDEAATRQLRDEERRARIARGRPYDEFVKDWVTPEPPADIPYMGCWDDPAIVYGLNMGQRVKMQGSALQSQFMLNPKDLRIAALQAQVEALRAELAGKT
jgi:acetone carboxylase alpha subunit